MIVSCNYKAINKSQESRICIGGAGLVLADRLARDKKLHVDEILDTFPGSLGTRLLGKYMSSTLATLVLILLIYMLCVGYVLARLHDPHSLLLVLGVCGAEEQKSGLADTCHQQIYKSR